MKTQSRYGKLSFKNELSLISWPGFTIIFTSNKFNLTVSSWKLIFTFDSPNKVLDFSKVILKKGGIASVLGNHTNEIFV